MELTRRVKSAPTYRTDPYANRSYRSENKSALQDDINRLDEWLWRNCRSHSEEMRKIEQQYM